MKRFLSEYRHVDGTRWAGPDFFAESFDEAQLAALEYPVQPILILGEHVETLNAGLDVARTVRHPQRQIIH